MKTIHVNTHESGTAVGIYDDRADAQYSGYSICRDVPAHLPHAQSNALSEAIELSQLYPGATVVFLVTSSLPCAGWLVEWEGEGEDPGLLTTDQLYIDLARVLVDAA